MTECQPNKIHGQGGEVPNVQGKPQPSELRRWEEGTICRNDAHQLQAPKHNTGAFLPGRGRQKGLSTENRPRCVRCILSHKGCDGVQPVCGRCQKCPERCQVPNGNPSRNGLLNLLLSERSGENLPHSISDEKSTDDSTPEDGPASNNIAEAQLTTRDRELQGASAPENQILGHVERRSTAPGIPTQHSSADQQFPGILPPEMQRLEQVRLKVLEATRAYLGTDPQLRVNTREPRSGTSEAEMSQSQGQMNLQASRTHVQQNSDLKSRIWESEAGTVDDDVLRAWLRPEAF